MTLHNAEVPSADLTTPANQAPTVQNPTTPGQCNITENRCTQWQLIPSSPHRHVLTNSATK